MISSLQLRWRWFRKELKKSTGRMWFVSCFGGLLFLGISLVVLVLAGHTLNVNFRDLPPSPDTIHRLFPLVDLRFFVEIGFFTSLILFFIGSFKDPYRIPYILFITSLWVLIRVVVTVITPLGSPEGRLLLDLEHFDVESIGVLIQSAWNSPNLLFFSGHTGFPFLGFLLFSKVKIILQALINVFNRQEINWKETIKLYFVSGIQIKVKTLAIPLVLITASGISTHAEWPWIAAISFGWILIIAHHKQTIPLAILLLVWSILNACAVFLTRSHYSVDILGAYFMTLGIYASGLLLFPGLVFLCESVRYDFKKIASANNKNLPRSARKNLEV
ncbi:hypothetical protein MYX06_04835 [Patescibacteria group bacterium AH-259-L05]|nr:hypothetical protein [Patescibacteria group bacterium AH-259-L05]